MNITDFYIGREWVKAHGTTLFEMINPSDESFIGKLSMGDDADVNRAVAAAKEGFQTYRFSTKQERLAILEKFLVNYSKRGQEIQEATTREMGAPAWIGQMERGKESIEMTIAVLKNYDFEERTEKSLVKKVPIGVAALITPWNWPLAVVLNKILTALATGCSMVLKPSEYSPLSAMLLAQILHESDVPKGVFNMVFGHGEIVGRALARHPDVDMVSLTGSTRAGIDVSKVAADTVKRVTLELGGKGPNIILSSGNFSEGVKKGLKSFMVNGGQTCSTPSRMIVPKKDLETAKAAILEAISEITVGNPAGGNVFIGPVVNANQYKRIQDYIQIGLDEGATLLTGGPGKPEGLSKGYYVRPTVFVDTKPNMKIVKEEIFGPVLVLQTYETVDEAIELANDTVYGLASYIQGENLAEIEKIADRMDAGQVRINLNYDTTAPFGGFKASGNGRENGKEGFAEYLESKALVGYYSF